MSESFYNLNYIYPFILGIQNLCRKAFEPIFTRELVFDLYVKHVFHGIKFVQIQTARWTKWDGAIKPSHVPFWVVQFIPVLERKFVPRMMSYLSCQALKPLELMRLFLSNLGNLKSCIMTTSCILRQPARVLTGLVPPSNFVITPFGRADLLIIETFKLSQRVLKRVFGFLWCQLYQQYYWSQVILF